MKSPNGSQMIFQSHCHASLVPLDKREKEHSVLVALELLAKGSFGIQSIAELNRSLSLPPREANSFLVTLRSLMHSDFARQQDIALSVYKQSWILTALEALEIALLTGCSLTLNQPLASLLRSLSEGGCVEMTLSATSHRSVVISTEALMTLY